MCDLGTYYGGHLTGEEMRHLIDLNFAADYDLPILGERSPVIYYLGGGDAALHPELVATLRAVQAKRPSCRQVVSTIGLDPDGGLKNMVDELTTIPGSGFQVSLCAFDDTVRRQLVGHNVQALTVRECVSLAEHFHDRCGRRGYLSIFLVRDLYEDVDAIASQVREMADPRKVHITLTVLRRNELPMSCNGSSMEKYEELRAKIAGNGYEVSISTNDQDEENPVSCGVMEEDILLNNRMFRKGGKRTTPR
jgi:hypothetical protein